MTFIKTNKTLKSIFKNYKAGLTYKKKLTESLSEILFSYKTSVDQLDADTVFSEYKNIICHHLLIKTETEINKQLFYNPIYNDIKDLTSIKRSIIIATFDVEKEPPMDRAGLITDCLFENTDPDLIIPVLHKSNYLTDGEMEVFAIGVK